MDKVVIDMSMSLDGYVAGPDDSHGQGLGGNGGEHLHDWLFSGDEPCRLSPFFHPEGRNRAVADELLARLLRRAARDPCSLPTARGCRMIDPVDAAGSSRDVAARPGRQRTRSGSTAFRTASMTSSRSNGFGITLTRG